MKRIERVYNTLMELCKEKMGGISAIEIADRLKIQRTNASSDLNKLVREGRVEKINGKPVLYKIKAIDKIEGRENTDVFESIIGAKLSLKNAVQQARAAIIYPPFGLHTLILGETGTGKSMFAELMYNYAKDIGKISMSAPFVAFNCADYSNNPQLLMAQLFGVKKGAYTGADRDRVGIVEKANNGILFLDEVHRLPPEGQEMLFYLMDKGIYRRLGETEVQHKANILIIAATTENIESSLLKTFIRRIPMLIKLPPLRERTLEERFQIIKQAFKEEALIIKSDISITSNAMKALLLYECSNNIGQLKSDIKLSCAKAFLSKMINGNYGICVHSEDLPQHVLMGLLKVKESKENLDIYIKKDIIKFSLDEKAYREENNIYIYNFYDALEEKKRLLEAKGINENDIKLIMSLDIDTYFKKYILNIDNQNFEELYKVVDKNIVNLVEEFLDEAMRKLDRKFSNKIFFGLSMHIESSIERIINGKKIENHQLEEIKKLNLLEFQVAEILREKIENKFNIKVPDDEVGFIAMFLCMDKEEKASNGKVGVVVAMHGETAATSIADVANRLLGENHAVGYNMPLDEKPEIALSNLTKIVRNADRGKGVLLLVDMGSLVFFGDMIYERIGVNVKVVNMVSTPMALEATRKALLGSSLEEVYASCIDTNPYVGRIYKEEYKFDTSIKKNVIVTACLTGEGTAIKLKNILEEKLKFNNHDIDIIPIQIYDRIEFDKNLEKIKKEKNIIAVVSSFKPQDNQILYISAYEIFNMKKIEYLSKVIHQYKTIENMKEVIEENLDIDSLKYINAFKLFYIDLLNCNIQIEENILIGLILHIGCAIERVLRGSKLIHNKYDKQILERYNNEMQIIKNCIIPIEQAFNINIIRDEIIYIVKMIYLI